MAAILSVPEFVLVWWQCVEGNQARVLTSWPYTGRYPQFFTHVLRVEAPNTKRGWLEMAYDARRPE